MVAVPVATRALRQSVSLRSLPARPCLIPCPAVPFHVRFDQLDDARQAALIQFFQREELLVKGLDGREWGEFRGGCLPILIVAAALAALPALFSTQAPRWLVITVVTAWMGWATSRFIRTAKANRRSRKLNASGDAWHGIAWDPEHLAYRSWVDCLLVPWDQVSELRYLDERWGPGLGDSLWMHMADGRKVRISDKEDRFAGRPLDEWFVDLATMLKDTTGRMSSRPAPVTR